MPIVYVLSNPSMPGLVKIGKTKNLRSLKNRMRSLFSSGVPTAFKLELAINAPGTNPEMAVHEAFKEKRIPGREFFKLAVDDAINVLEHLGKDVTPKSRKRRRRPNAKYISDLGIPKGSRLTFVFDRRIVAIVVEDRKFRFRGDLISPAMATRRANGWHDKKPAGSTSFWRYRGVLVSEIYTRVHGERG